MRLSFRGLKRSKNRYPHRNCVRAPFRRSLTKGYADGREARVGIAAWIAFYNHRRVHQALGYRAPMAVWREGAARAVDMMDNAVALPTYPQQQQKTTSLAA